jgi:tetratricopeptide (TPR) repeat protein
MQMNYGLRNFIPLAVFLKYIINELYYAMKFSYQSILQTLTCSLYLFLVFANNAMGQEKNITAIVAVLNAKSEAYYNGDIEKWKSYWIQDSLSSRSIISRFGYAEQFGWPEIDAQIVKDRQEDETRDVKISHVNVRARFSGTIAYVYAIQLLKKQNDSIAFSIPTYSILIYDNGNWKIANQIRLASQTFETNAENREYMLNVTGYELLAEKRIKEAIELFTLVVKLNPNSWNAFDSLGEAYEIAGEIKPAIANYEKSVQLNPDNESAKKKIKALKK